MLPGLRLFQVADGFDTLQIAVCMPSMVVPVCRLWQQHVPYFITVRIAETEGDIVAPF